MCMGAACAIEAKTRNYEHLREKSKEKDAKDSGSQCFISVVAVLKSTHFGSILFRTAPLLVLKAWPKRGMCRCTVITFGSTGWIFNVSLHRVSMK